MLNNLIRIYLKQNKCNIHDGFTLIELLVVVIIIGILAAIALPNLLNQVGKAKAVEAKTTIASINKAQAAYRMEHSTFANDMAELNLGLPTKTRNYDYQIEVDGNQTTVTAKANDNALHGYSGGVVQFTDASGESATTSIICENKLPGIQQPEIPTLTPTKNVPEEAAKCSEEQNQL